MTDQTKDFIIYGIIILIFVLILRGKQTAVVSSKIISGNQEIPVDASQQEFDYAVCGVSPDVINNGLHIRVCIDPATGKEYPVEQYPQGNYGQVVFLRDTQQVDRSNFLNGVPNFDKPIPNFRGNY